MSPSEQHERWRLSLLANLSQRLNGCVWCGLGLRRDHPARCHVLRPAHNEPVAHRDVALRSVPRALLRPASGRAPGRRREAAVSTERHPLPTGHCRARRVRQAAGLHRGRPHTPLGARVAAAKELGIPLSVIPAPDESLFNQRWAQLSRGGTRARIPRPGLREGFRDVHTEARSGDDDETPVVCGTQEIEDDSRNVVWSRFRGSAPNLDDMAYPAIGTALVAKSCTWSCARAVAALRAQDELTLGEYAPSYG